MPLRELLADVIEIQRKAIFNDTVFFSEKFGIFIFILTNYKLSIHKILKRNEHFKRISEISITDNHIFINIIKLFIFHTI